MNNFCGGKAKGVVSRQDLLAFLAKDASPK